MPLLCDRRESDSMDVERESTDARTPSAMTRYRSYSHQLPSSSNMNAQNPHHRLDFEFNLEDHIKKTRKAAGYLKQVFHSQSCGGQCGSGHCRRIVDILSHVDICEYDYCSVGGCATTKKLLRHCQECGSHSPVRSTLAGNSNVETPRTSVDSSASSIVSQTSVSSPLPSGRIVPHFCMLCTLAKVDVLSPRSTASLQQAGYHPEDLIQSPREDGDSEDDSRFMPIISDEIIEFSKIPFQQRSRVHSLSPMRSKTYSDSRCFDAEVTPLSPASSQPSKKQRSKSCDGVNTVDLESIRKQLQFPQVPVVSTYEG